MEDTTHNMTPLNRKSSGSIHRKPACGSCSYLKKNKKSVIMALLMFVYPILYAITSMHKGDTAILSKKVLEYSRATLLQMLSTPGVAFLLNREYNETEFVHNYPTMAPF